MRSISENKNIRYNDITSSVIGHGGQKVNRLFRLFLLILFILSLTSCSYLSRRMGLSSDDKSKTIKDEFVPKSQYDELLGKYEVLLKEKSGNGDVEKITTSSLISDSSDMQMKPQAKSDTDLIHQLEDSSLASTVDIFGSNEDSQVRKAKISNGPDNNLVNKDNNIENELLLLAKAKSAADKNEFKKSLGFLTEIENSQNEQIKVRAKFNIADLLFRQQEYDLAMQAYEDIISNYAFSGVAVATLGRLVACAEKLKLSKKRDHYYSLLHDVFQME